MKWTKPELSKFKKPTIEDFPGPQVVKEVSRLCSLGREKEAYELMMKYKKFKEEEPDEG